MKLLRIFGIPLLLVLFSAACESPAAQNEDRPPRSNGATVIQPRAGDGMQLSGVEARPEDTAVEESGPSIRVELAAGTLVADVLETNLTGNNFEEQVVAFRRPDDSDGGIRVAVIENDITGAGYQLVWEGVTAAHNMRGLRISSADITGDYEPEIVISGVDDSGRETMNIFMRDLSDPTLTFVEIGAFASTGSVELVRTDRSDEYYVRETPGEPYSVITQESDPDSDSILDIVERRFSYSREESSFVEESERFISGGDVEQAQLQTLFSGGSAEFETFLSGPWYRETGDGLSILTFDTRTERVVFNGGEMQESFDWELSRKTVSSGVQIMMRNRNIRSMNTFVRIRVTGLDQITVDMNDRSRWDGTYRRVSGSLLATLMRTDAGRTAPMEVYLDGTYADDSGVEIHFLGSRFELVDGGDRFRGTYSAYEAGGQVIELVKFDQSLRRVGRRVYTFEHEIDEHHDRIVRSLSLQPARLTSDGVSSAPGRALNLEQVELIDGE